MLLHTPRRNIPLARRFTRRLGGHERERLIGGGILLRLPLLLLLFGSEEAPRRLIDPPVGGIISEIVDCILYCETC